MPGGAQKAGLGSHSSWLRRPPHPWPEQLGLRVEGSAVHGSVAGSFNSHLDDD